MSSEHEVNCTNNKCKYYNEKMEQYCSYSDDNSICYLDNMVVNKWEELKKLIDFRIGLKEFHKIKGEYSVLRYIREEMKELEKQEEEDERNR